jgi:effector-binding domain-containing protein
LLQKNLRNITLWPTFRKHSAEYKPLRMPKSTAFVLSIYFAALFFTSCGEDKKQDTDAKKEAVVEKDTVKREAPEKPAAVKRPPIINITDTIAIKRKVLCMKDSAATIERVSMKLGEIFNNKLSALVAKNKMKVTGPPMAWYRGTKAPFYFEAGIPVEKVSGKLPPKVTVKQVGTDSVVVAHFYGPYSELPVAYETLSDWIKDRKKSPKGKPYEIYVGDPIDKEGKPVDPYKVQTDVVFPWQ